MVFSTKFVSDYLLFDKQYLLNKSSLTLVVVYMNPIEIVSSMMKFEGLSFEEAVSTFKIRQELPDLVFAGPNRTFPAYNAESCVESLNRLSTFGKKLSPDLCTKVHDRLVREAKKHEVSHVTCWICGGEEFKETVDRAIEWYIKKPEFEEAKKLWIAGAIKKKGALRAQLGIKEGETIPKSLLQRIVGTETGKKVSFKGKSITVTTQLKRRALLALKLGKMKK